MGEEVRIKIETLKRILRHGEYINKLVDKMYLDWAREKKLLNMTSIFAEMYLVFNKKEEHRKLSDFAYDQMVHSAKKEWGDGTMVYADYNFVLVENKTKKRKANIFISDGIVVLDEISGS